jgi:YHS domain-containing protein
MMTFRSLALASSLVALVAACRQTPADPDPNASATPSASAKASAGPSANPSPAVVAAASASAPSTQGALTRVEGSKVCMVNDQFMEVEQIPVEVGGKTYFGCCAMCKAKLENNDGARTAVDPVSGTRVDKATAVIGRAPSNKVYYFESEATMRRFTL